MLAVILILPLRGQMFKQTLAKLCKVERGTLFENLLLFRRKFKTQHLSRGDRIVLQNMSKLLIYGSQTENLVDNFPGHGRVPAQKKGVMIDCIAGQGGSLLRGITVSIKIPRRQAPTRMIYGLRPLDKRAKIRDTRVR